MTVPTLHHFVASGDFRLAANQAAWPGQRQMEEHLIGAFLAEGVTLRRTHPVERLRAHGFIDSQHSGIELLRRTDPAAPLVVIVGSGVGAEHVLPGLVSRTGPLLTLAPWSGQWSAPAGLLDLNGALVRAGVSYSTIWSESFDDAVFKDGLRTWITTGQLGRTTHHTRSLGQVEVPHSADLLGRALAARLQQDKTLMGVVGDGGTQTPGSILPDDLLRPLGVFKEYLGASMLLQRMKSIPGDEARRVLAWLSLNGMEFLWGRAHANALTRRQMQHQCRMYVSAVRLAHEYGCDAIGIQYRAGLQEFTSSPALTEGLLNNALRPPVRDRNTGQILFRGTPVPHFNDGDECAGLDALVTRRVWDALKLPAEGTRHSLSWGRHYTGPDASGRERDEFIWSLQVDGAAPPAHFARGFAGAVSERQPVFFSKNGGGGIKGLCKPGWIVWSRVFVEKGRLCFDTGLGESVALPAAETEDRWNHNTPQWPLLQVVFPDISRDDMMARHRSGHVWVAYGADYDTAREALFTKAAMMSALGLDVSICGKV